MLRMCLNWKVLGGLAIVGGAVAVAAPGAALALLPLLVLAACPLSMLAMAAGMGRMSSHHTQEGSAASGDASPADRSAELDAQLTRLRRVRDGAVEEIARIEGEGGTSSARDRPIPAEKVEMKRSHR